MSQGQYSEDGMHSIWRLIGMWRDQGLTEAEIQSHLEGIAPGSFGAFAHEQASYHQEAGWRTCECEPRNEGNQGLCSRSGHYCHLIQKEK